MIKIYGLSPIGTPVNIIGSAYTGRMSKEGSRGDDVEQLQQDLKLGYYNFSTDGVFGPKTTEKLKSFQADYDLASDGIVGPYPYLALEKVIDIAHNNFEP